ncbi:hypothetical protein [Burkholderia glumae]|uniref:hypothetical protein n=1 Tax=Burkholderia glumae TaxID=337 RepID=UPI00039D0441|nr:hypothetical protein [Burkholderia glumae]MCM2494573.1 hypothetical protein [Burkholderia glumae]
MNTEPIHGWSTKAELDFVDQLADSASAISLLQGYLAGMKHRVDFGQIDPGLITRYANERLGALTVRLAS